MKPVALILSFLPLIAFSLLARLPPNHDINVAALVAVVLLPEILLGTVVPVVVIPYGLKFSKDYPARVTHADHPAEAPAGRAAAS